ncbi:hypothetical protein JD499_04570 [Aeromonas enteropelogenes]|uniref:hypothetical protein n=1 Tax=Aeromonas enteropelogenes TaxID=29489 RepID=UPI00191D6E91|nr:hypothetical protein [Aeromonas enteropelogenes]MBL0456488.1 hypothetical protein [Aeromonas enteropelogenes]
MTREQIESAVIATISKLRSAGKTHVQLRMPLERSQIQILSEPQVYTKLNDDTAALTGYVIKMDKPIATEMKISGLHEINGKTDQELAAILLDELFTIDEETL